MTSSVQNHPKRPLELEAENSIDCEVFIIGAGPAGSTCAARLRRQGVDVVLVEKDQHPRFHIGESLLPANIPLLEDLGVADAVKAVGMNKLGIEFNSPTHAKPAYLEFADAWDKSMSYAYQVRRSEFDAILFHRAQELGARTFQNCKVKQVDFPEQDTAPIRITTQKSNGDVQHFDAKFLIDASGRDTFLAKQLDCKLKNPKHNSAALYGHFEGVQRLEGDKEGYISLFWFDHGWFWLIPLADGSTSIGAVCWPYYLHGRKKPVQEFFMDTIASCPLLADRMRSARLVSPVSSTGNYSYHSAISHQKRALLVGDAYAFIDPVFSSGVLLAMQGAFEAAKVAATALRQPNLLPLALKNYAAHVRHGPQQFSWFIHRITNPMMRELFMQPRNHLRVKEAILSLLAGDIFHNKAIWPSVWVFKGIYYISSAWYWRRTWQAIQRRRVNIRDMDITHNA